MPTVLQTQALKLGITTSLSLPAQTRLLFQRLQVRYPRYRLALKLSLWVLYGLAEAAIIATDIAELVGSAIGLALYASPIRQGCNTDMVQIQAIPESAHLCRSLDHRGRRLDPASVLQLGSG